MNNIDSQINDRMNTYAGNPQGLMQRYAQTQELVDLLALQKMKNDRAAATNAVQGAMQPPPGTVKGQLEQEAMQGARNDVLRSMAPGIQQQGQRMAQMQNRAAMGLPTQAAPNMARMANGGIVGYAPGGGVKDLEKQLEKIARIEEGRFYQPRTGRNAAGEQVETDKNYVVPDAEYGGGTYTSAGPRTMLMNLISGNKGQMRQSEYDAILEQLATLQAQEAQKTRKAAIEQDIRRQERQPAFFNKGGIVGYADGGDVVAKKPQMPVAGQTQNPSPAYLDPEVATFLRELSNLNKQKADAFPQEKDLFDQKITDLINTTSPRVKRIASDSPFGLPKKEGMAQGGIVGYQKGGGPIGANNPFNLRDYNQDWQGQSGATRGFVDFEDEFSGVRAADKLLNNYGTREGIDTLRGAIARFAPPNENLTEDYISFVSEQTGIPSEQPIDLGNEGTRRSILAAMAKMESGRDIDVANVLANDESRFGVTTDRGMSRSEAQEQDSKRKPVDRIPFGSPEFAARQQRIGEAAKEDVSGILNALVNLPSTVTGSLYNLATQPNAATRLMQRGAEASGIAPFMRGLGAPALPTPDPVYGFFGGDAKPKEADVPGVLNDMPQPSDAQRFANAFEEEDEEDEEDEDSRDDQQPKGGLDIDFRALREFLAGGAGQTSTAGALAGGARGLGAFQTAEQGRQDKINQAAAELQLKRDLATNDAEMLNARLVAEYKGKIATALIDVAQSALEDTQDPLNIEFTKQAAAIRDQYKRNPLVMEEALNRLYETTVDKAVDRVRRGAGLGSAPSTGTQIAGPATRISE